MRNWPTCVDMALCSWSFLRTVICWLMVAPAHSSKWTDRAMATTSSFLVCRPGGNDFSQPFRRALRMFQAKVAPLDATWRLRWWRMAPLRSLSLAPMPSPQSQAAKEAEEEEEAVDAELLAEAKEGSSNRSNLSKKELKLAQQTKVEATASLALSTILVEHLQLELNVAGKPRPRSSMHLLLRDGHPTPSQSFASSVGLTTRSLRYTSKDLASRPLTPCSVNMGASPECSHRCDRIRNGCRICRARQTSMRAGSIPWLPCSGSTLSLTLSRAGLQEFARRSPTAIESCLA
mmetsp:Transcript_76408/g.181739  ORF Transcript_76408/g.181739 Transcript_76408/m.181739 type:complete len:290 (+) Transcript_76408:527-1396(+)